MKIRSLIVVAVAATAMTLPVAAQAGHDECHTTTLISAAGVLYYDDRAADLKVAGQNLGKVNGFVEGSGTWVYLESNGKPGLQRGGESILLGDLDEEICKTYAGTPDTLIL